MEATKCGIAVYSSLDSMKQGCTMKPAQAGR